MATRYSKTMAKRPDGRRRGCAAGLSRYLRHRGSASLRYAGTPERTA